MVPAKASLTPSAAPIQSAPAPLAFCAAPEAARMPFTYSRRVPAPPSCTIATYDQPVVATDPVMLLDPPKTQRLAGSSQIPYQGPAARLLATMLVHEPGSDDRFTHAETVKS